MSWDWYGGTEPMLSVTVSQTLTCDCQLFDYAFEFMPFIQRTNSNQKRMKGRREQRSASPVNPHFIAIVCFCPVSPSSQPQYLVSFSVVLILHDI
jgi:hypothetical protein